MEELSVGSCTDFINDGRLEIDEDGSGDVLTGTSLGEKGVEGIITTTDGLIRRLMVLLQSALLFRYHFPGPTFVTDNDCFIRSRSTSSRSRVHQ